MIQIFEPHLIGRFLTTADSTDDRGLARHSKINVDSKTHFRYLDIDETHLIDASKCCAILDADTQLSIFGSSNVKKQLLVASSKPGATYEVKVSFGQSLASPSVA